MNTRQFNKLSKGILKEGAKFCAENADQHFKVAVFLARDKFFPNANSHLILASEEAVKSILCSLKLILPEMEVNVHEVFHKHKHKHKIAQANYDFLYKTFQILIKSF